jgi:hypothetical protein
LYVRWIEYSEDRPDVQRDALNKVGTGWPVTTSLWLSQRPRSQNGALDFGFILPPLANQRYPRIQYNCMVTWGPQAAPRGEHKQMNRFYPSTISPSALNFDSLILGKFLAPTGD